MIVKRKSYFVIFLLLTAAAIIFLSFFQDFKKSTSLLDSKENKITISFDLKDNDQKNFDNILNNLNIPQTVVEGASFELDSTSFAALTYLTPIKSNLKIDASAISFSGETSHSPFSTNSQLETIKAPESSNLIIYSENLIDFVIAGTSLSTQFELWLKDNFPKKFPSYLIIFGAQSDFAIITNNIDINYSSLSSIFSQDQLEDSYKVETQNEIFYHLVNINSKDIENSQTLALFNIANWQVLASSRDAAFSISSSINSNDQSLNFPPKNIDNSANFLLFYRNSKKFPISQNFINLIFEDNSSAGVSLEYLKETLQKIESLDFALKEDDFSGLIEFK